eukprot:TRINITY_DN8336_c0_g1_i5.p1 TRINITY_DN8336_c0_g1~~TRINITY_DN8336_c0_g1_i5.p1  ORF type:complete len:1478 (+),score=190.53 TRINITY_DN8336_c0_g1_i5:45-4478(+)
MDTMDRDTPDPEEATASAEASPPPHALDAADIAAVSLQDIHQVESLPGSPEWGRSIPSTTASPSAGHQGDTMPSLLRQPHSILRSSTSTPPSDSLIASRRKSLRLSLCNPSVRVCANSPPVSEAHLLRTRKEARRASVPAPLLGPKSSSRFGARDDATPPSSRDSDATVSPLLDNDTDMALSAALSFVIPVESTDSSENSSGSSTTATSTTDEDLFGSSGVLQLDTAKSNPVAFDTGVWSSHEEERFLQQWCERVPLPRTSLENLHGKGLGRHGSRKVPLSERGLDWVVVSLLVMSCATYIFLVVFGESLRHECLTPCGQCGNAGFLSSIDVDDRTAMSVMSMYSQYNADVGGSNWSAPELCGYDWEYAAAERRRKGVSDEVEASLIASGVLDKSSEAQVSSGEYRRLLHEATINKLRQGERGADLVNTLHSYTSHLDVSLGAWNYDVVFGVLFRLTSDSSDTADGVASQLKCLEDIKVSAEVTYPNGKTYIFTNRSVDCHAASDYCAVSLFGDGIGSSNEGVWNFSATVSRCDGLHTNLFVYKGRKMFYISECVIRHFLLVVSVMLFVALIKRRHDKAKAHQPSLGVRRLLYGVYPMLFLALNPVFLLAVYLHGESLDSSPEDTVDPNIYGDVRKQFFFLMADLPPRLLIGCIGIFLMSLVTHDTMDLKHVPSLLAVSIDRFIPFGVPKSVVSLSVKIKKDSFPLAKLESIKSVYDTIATEFLSRLASQPNRGNVAHRATVPQDFLADMIHRHAFVRSVLKADLFDRDEWQHHVGSMPVEAGEDGFPTGVTRNSFVEGWFALLNTRSEHISPSSEWIRPKSKAFSTFHFDLSEYLLDTNSHQCSVTVKIKLRYMTTEKERSVRITNDMLRSCLAREVLLPLPIFVPSATFCDLESVLVAAALVILVETGRPEVRIRVSGWLPVTLPGELGSIKAPRQIAMLLVGLAVIGTSTALSCLLATNVYRTRQTGEAAVLGASRLIFLHANSYPAEVAETVAHAVFVAIGIVLVVEALGHIRAIPHRHARCMHLLVHMIVYTALFWGVSTIISNIVKPVRLVSLIRPWRDGDLLVLPLAGYIFAITLSLFPPPVFSVGLNDVTKKNLATFLRETGGMRLRAFRSMTEKLYIDQWLTFGKRRHAVEGLSDGKLGGLGTVERNRHDSRPLTMPVVGANNKIQDSRALNAQVMRLGSRRRLTISHPAGVPAFPKDNVEPTADNSDPDQYFSPVTPALCYNLPLSDKMTANNCSGGDWKMTRKQRRRKKSRALDTLDGLPGRSTATILMEEDDIDSVRAVDNSEARTSLGGDVLEGPTCFLQVGGNEGDSSTATPSSLSATATAELTPSDVTPQLPYGDDVSDTATNIELNDTFASMQSPVGAVEREVEPEPEPEPSPRDQDTARVNDVDELSQAFCLETAVHCCHASTLCYEPVLRPTRCSGRKASLLGSTTKSTSELTKMSHAGNIWISTLLCRSMLTGGHGTA